MSITEVAIKRPLLILVIFVTLILFGIISYKSMNYSLLPKFDANVISVMTVYRGASSEEVQNSVTKPIEEAIASIEGVDIMSSTSSEGMSMIVVQLKPGISTIVAQRDGERKINMIKLLLPPDADDPVVNRFNTDEFPVLRISTNANLKATDLYDLVNLKIKPELGNVKGVGTINLLGGVSRQIDVELDNEKLRSYGIPAALVNQILTTSNTSYPAGSVETGENRLSIQLDAKATKVQDLRELVIRKNRDGSMVFLKDVATVTDGASKFTTINRFNGKAGLGIEISKQADANTVEVCQLAVQKLDSLKERYKSTGFEYEVAIDQSTYTLASANGVMEDLGLAIAIVALVMLLFLHSAKSASFVLVSLPAAMIPTFILMYALGFSLNLMTLMALSLVVGILVDDSIVVLENIFRHLEMGKSRRQAAIDGRQEIGFTALAITLVDVVVFVPMALAGGMIGNILREFSLVVVASTLMSLFVSFTLTPLMASRWANVEVLNKKTLWGRFNLLIERFLDFLKDSYGAVLAWVLKGLGRRFLVLGGIFLAFVFTGFVMSLGLVGTAFVSPGDKGEFNLILELDAQAPLYQTNLVSQKVENLLLDKPEVKRVFASVGTRSAQMGLASATDNYSQISVQLVDKEDRKMSTDDFSSMIRDTVSKIPGVKVISQIPGITGTSEAPIQIAVKGTDMDSIWKAAKIVRDIVAKVPGSDYVEYSTGSPKPELDIRLDKEKMALVGLSTNEVGAAVQLAFRGNDRTKFKSGGNDYAIKLEVDQADRKDIESIRNLTVINNRGAAIRLEEFAEVATKQGQPILERLDRLNSVKITATGVGRPNGTIVADIEKELKEVKLPVGVELQTMGEAERQKDAFGSLGIAMGIGFLLVYLIMVALYESVIHPFIVMFSIPVAMIGAFLALALTMESMTIFAIVGLIMLLGLVAKNGILIVDFAKHLYEKGMDLREALVEAGRERLRPILMTTLAMVAGMMPIATASGEGAEVKNGMAWVIIGGLTSSLFLTLLLVPVMFYIVETWRTRLGKWFGRNKTNTEVPHTAKVEAVVLEN
jgi:hydrophobic/amphiphilic exporter-1 (mainly G- bacteria), HAE1 family